MENDEVKIIFYEGTEVRSLRGTILNEDEFFINLQRNDGNFRIGKKFIVKIEAIYDAI
jgi:hypothetical protein